MAFSYKKPIPPLTCPHIDRVSELLDSIINVAKDKDTSVEILAKYRDIANAELEFIRQSNDELRLASVYWYKKAKRIKAD